MKQNDVSLENSIQIQLEKLAREEYHNEEEDVLVFDEWELKDFIDQLLAEKEKEVKEGDILDEVMSDEVGEQFWISEEFAASPMEAYKKFVVYWSQTGPDIDMWPKASEIEEWIGYWQGNGDSENNEWIADEEKGTIYYYIRV